MRGDCSSPRNLFSTGDQTYSRTPLYHVGMSFSERAEQEYIDAVKRALSFVQAHLDEEIVPAQLAGAAGFSQHLASSKAILELRQISLGGPWCRTWCLRHAAFTFNLPDSRL